MSARYAENTTVPIGRTRDELERLLSAHGATGFASGWDQGHGVYAITCRLADRMLRFTIPRAHSDEHRLTPTGQRRNDTEAQRRAYAEDRRRWRALLLVTKAKFVAVADGVQTLEQAFLSDILLPDGSTVGEWMSPQLDTAYATARMPEILPAMRPALERGR